MDRRLQEHKYVVHLEDYVLRHNKLNRHVEQTCYRQAPANHRQANQAVQTIGIHRGCDRKIRWAQLGMYRENYAGKRLGSHRSRLSRHRSCRCSSLGIDKGMHAPVRQGRHTFCYRNYTALQNSKLNVNALARVTIFGKMAKNIDQCMHHNKNKVYMIKSQLNQTA